jgi:hypothetical protein
MIQSTRWFRPSRLLTTRTRQSPLYYEDVHGHQNADETLQGVHILASESDSDTDGDIDSLTLLQKRKAQRKEKKRLRRGKKENEGTSVLYL